MHPERRRVPLVSDRGTLHLAARLHVLAMLAFRVAVRSRTTVRLRDLLTRRAVALVVVDVRIRRVDRVVVAHLGHGCSLRGLHGGDPRVIVTTGTDSSVWKEFLFSPSGPLRDSV